MLLIWRVLTFRATREELLGAQTKHLYIGLLWTWLVGMGRYWDNPKANWAQHLGLGSVIYVFVLAAIIWIVVAPLTTKLFNYRNLLTYITLTAPLAILYAIPVEKFMSLENATDVNVAFLAVVAIWRVALFWRYLKLVPVMNMAAKFVAGLLPLTAIVFSLMVLNLEHVVFDLMGGIRERSANDGAYSVVFMLGFLSLYAAPCLAIVWMVLAAHAASIRSDAKARESS